MVLPQFNIWHIEVKQKRSTPTYNIELKSLKFNFVYFTIRSQVAKLNFAYRVYYHVGLDLIYINKYELYSTLINAKKQIRPCVFKNTKKDNHKVGTAVIRYIYRKSSSAGIR